MTACPVDLATTKNGVGRSSFKIFDNCIFLQNETNRGDNKTVNRMNMYTDFVLCERAGINELVPIITGTSPLYSVRGRLTCMSDPGDKI